MSCSDYCEICYKLQLCKKSNIKLAIEGIAITVTEVDKEKGIISTIILETGGK